MNDQSTPNATSSLHLVNQDLRPFLEVFPPLSLNAQTLQTIRDMPEAETPSHDDIILTERFIKGPSDNPDLRILMLDPRMGGDKTPCPVLVHMHGGGFVLGTADNSIAALLNYARAAQCVIVTVDYRLAPETIFERSVEDNYTALKWVYDNADELGIDANRIAVGGESAGGSHAAALAILARDLDEVPLCFQFLIYPMLDDRTGSTQSALPYTGEFIWNADSNQFGWTAHLGVPAGSETVPYPAVPARVEDLSGLPPTYIASCALDLFIQEDLLYATRLIAAGVRTDIYVEAGAYHGFNAMNPDTDTSRRFNARIGQALKQGFESL